MKAVVAAFNQEKAPVGAFSVITNLRMELFEALVSSGQQCSGGAGAVTDRDVVWGRSASWSPQITMFWLVTRCHAVTRCHGDKYYCHVTCVHNVPVSTNNMLGVGAVHLGTSA